MVALIYLGDEKLACNLLNKPSSGFKYPGGPGAAPPGRRWAAAKPLRAPSRFPRIPTEVGKRKWEVASISLQTAPSFTELTLKAEFTPEQPQTRSGQWLRHTSGRSQ